MPTGTPIARSNAPSNEDLVLSDDPLLLQTTRLAQRVRDRLDAVAAAASNDSAADHILLRDFLERAITAANRGGLSVFDRARYRGAGADAAGRGVPLVRLLDLYLSATWRLWKELTRGGVPVSASALSAVAEGIFHAADDAVAALVQGYEDSQRRAIRREEAAQREFVDDLLTGHVSDDFADRAQRFGFAISGPHHVVIATAKRDLVDFGPIHSRIADAAETDARWRDALISTKDGYTVFVLRGENPDANDEVVALLERVGQGSCQVAAGEIHTGAGGVARSFSEAKDALTIARRLGHEGQVISSAAMRPYQLLSSDSPLAARVVDEVLGGLAKARGGAEILTDTLRALFLEQGNVTATARRLHLTPRGVVHRLATIERLTGYSPQRSDHRFILELAVVVHTIAGDASRA